jgi:hypothetical protein
MAETDAVHLVAALAGESARQLAHTTNSLLASERERALDLARALDDLCLTLDAIPDHARTVLVERALYRASVAWANARDGLAGRWYDLPGDER